MSDGVEVITAHRTGTIGFAAKLAAYARLAKLRVYHHFYAWLLVVLLLRHESVNRPGAPVALGLVLLSMVAIKAATCAADDVVGFRDGSDAKNYASGGHLPPSSKPLLTGALTEREAVAFGAGSAIVTAVAGLSVFAVLGWDVPVGVVIGAGLTCLLSVQYSWGVKFSYRPGGLELVIFCVNAMEVLLAHWLIARQITLASVVISALVGVSMLLVVSYANFADRSGDLESGRRTLAAVVSPRAFRGLLIGLTVSSVVLLVVPFVIGTVRPVLIGFVLPAIVLRAVQVYRGVIRDELQPAVRLGFRCIDAGGIGVLLALALS